MIVAAGAFALGVGADLVDAEALRQGNLQKISSAAQELVQAVNAARATVRESKGRQVVGKGDHGG